MTKRLSVFFFFSAAIYAGQSFVFSVTTQTLQNTSVPAQSGAWYKEFYVDAIPATLAANPWFLNFNEASTGLSVEFSNGCAPNLCLTSNLDGIGLANTIVGLNFPTLALYIRVQHDSATLGGAHTNTDYFEVWDTNGVERYQNSVAYTTASTTSNGAHVLGTADAQHLAFVRMCRGAVLPLASKMPTTAGGCLTGTEVYEWKFDGNLNDSSGKGFNATLSGGGSARYATTLFQNVIAVLKTSGAPSWSNWVSLRAGHPNRLDGASGLSQSDSSSTITCFWQVLAGPSIPVWDSRASCTPTLTGLVFGAYRFSLQVSDAAGNQATGTLDVGAVAYDDNGVVIPADPNVTKIFGPMIAFGQNPWGYEDERNAAAVALQIANNTYYTSMAAVWSVSGQGTVSYPFAGVGFGQPGASLNGAITATATSIAIHNAERITGLTSLPTWIVIGGSGSTGELIRITGTTGTSGDQTLTVGYDGRGLASYPFGNSNVVPAQAWSDGTVVGEMRIQGTGTLFATDANRPLCPAGVPGPPGPVTYSTGTVRLAAGSTAVAGTGTNWTTGNGVQASYMIRVAATHGGGTPFVWWAQITTVGDTTHITASRPAPADVDTGTDFSYKITGARYLSLEFTDSAAPIYGAGNTLTTRALQNLMGCESETAAFATAAHDLPALDSTTQSGVKYSYKNSLGAASAFGPNFYGTGLALREFYYRSGYGPALTAANLIDDYWIRDPEICAGYCTGEPLLSGGGYLGGLANTVLNSSALTHWPDLRPWASIALNWFNTNHGNCNNNSPFDTRDQAYYGLYLTMAGIFDPDGTQQASWLTGMGSAGNGAGTLGRDNLCKRADNSFAVGILGGPTIHLTHGSAIATGTGLDHVGASGAKACAGVASGTITVNHGSAVATLVTGSLGNPATNFNIVIRDTTSSPSYVGFFQFSFNGSAVILAGLWPGASGTFSFLVQDNSQGLSGLGGGNTAIGLDGSDADNVRLVESWACTYNSPTQITLNRPWDDSVTGGNVHPTGDYIIYPAPNSGAGIGGYFQQPFMYGIKTKVVSYAANYAPNSTISSGYQSLLPLMGQWFHDVGYDTNTDGSYYARVNLACEPFVQAKRATDPPDSSVFDSIHGSSQLFPCGSNGLAGSLGGGNGEFTMRVDSAEAFAAVLEYYRAQCLLGTSQCSAARAFGDRAYGAIWGNCSMTSGGGATYFCDSHYVNTGGELSNGSIGAFKWVGFFFGMGMSHQWPAVRQGGVQAAQNRTIYIAFDIGQAASVRIIVTAPSGTPPVVYACGASPCAITVDDLQGSHWFQIQYLSATGQVLSESAPDLLR